jgi:DNA primase
VSMPVTWETLPDVVPEDFDVRTVPGLYERDGDPHAGLDDAVCGLETPLEWYERSGLGDLPYPPEYPKLEGEPMRVQPSRARSGS